MYRSRVGVDSDPIRWRAKVECSQQGKGLPSKLPDVAVWKTRKHGIHEAQTGACVWWPGELSGTLWGCGTRGGLVSNFLGPLKCSKVCGF